RARIDQSSALLPVADEPASLLRDVSEGKAYHTDSGFGANQDRANIAKTSTLPYDSAPRVTSHTAAEGTIGVAKVSTSSGSIITAGPPAAEVPTGNDEVPTGSDVVPTAESETPKKKKIQEQMDIQMARQLEEEMERDAQRMNEQIARDAKIARIHAEKELQIMIDGLDRSNETVAKYLQEYHQFATELP
nr:hypothetical protein [Tanacetum cinerariifolium]